VAFLSSRGGKARIWAVDIDGGESRLLRELPVDVDNVQVSADGRLLVFGAETYPDCPDLDCTAKRDEEKKSKKSTGRLFSSLFVRHWDSWFEGKRNHLFAAKVEGGPVVDLLRGLDADCPTKPWGGVEDFSISPDGKQVVFSLKKPMGSEEAWSTNEDIWTVPADGGAAPANLTADNLARDSMPSYSPDGKSIAYLAMTRPGYEADRYRVVVHELAQGSRRVLTEPWDRSPDSLRWSRDGRSLWVTADHLGQHAVFAVDAKSGKEKLVVAEGFVTSPLETERELLFLRDSFGSPADFWSAPPRGGREKRLTELNREALVDVALGEAEQFTFDGAKGDKVYAYLVKPVGFDPAKKYPLAFIIHGGPQQSFGNHFHYRWNPQTYAGAGYATVMVDFHGSTGYGQAFTDAIRGDWGGAPFEDLMKGMDAAVARYPWIDGSRACALGASYGGYMVNWIAGQTDRFKCLVTHDGNLDERFAYFDTEELWFPE
jgi:dipeptidyl aminopeptidase/acylaminoacyl peptidase